MLASVPEYRADVERAGLEFVPLGAGFAHYGDYGALLRKVFDVRHGTEFVVREMVMPQLRLTYEQLLRASEGVDLLASHPLTVTAPLVAEQRGLPWAATVLSPMSLMSSWDPPVIAGAEWLRATRRFGRRVYDMVFSLPRLIGRRWEAPLRAFRRELGLPPRRGLALLEGQFSPHLNLALFDPQLAARQPDWPARLAVTGAPLYDGVHDDYPEEGEPLVFALGSSAVWVAGDFWEHAVRAANELGRRAILIVGRDTPARLPSLPDTVKVFPYLPYSKVFPRASAVIHQAGIGTLSQAMRSGRPQLIVPFAFDQPDNARRAAALGVARVIPRKAYRRIRTELEQLLADASYARKAKTLAAELSKIDGAESAADALLKMVTVTNTSPCPYLSG